MVNLMRIELIYPLFMPIFFKNKVIIMRKISEIILHCSATQEGKDFKASDINRWHKQQGWNEIGYNFVIDLDGTIEEGRNIDKVPAHCAGRNAHSIGICYIGGCDKNNKAKDTRTEAQKLSMYKLIKELCIKYHIDVTDVHCHNEYAKNKSCPSFDIYKFRAEFTTWLAGKIEEPKKKVKCPFCNHDIEIDLLNTV